MNRRVRIGAFVLTAAELARFWSHVKVGTRAQCWPFRSKTGGRYRLFRLYRSGKVVWLGAHVVALAWRVRRAFKLATHTCDTPECCNPYHLRGGTASSNLREAWARGRRVA